MGINLVEINSEILNLAGITLVTIFLSWRLYTQGRTVWVKRSGESLSAPLFIFSFYFYINCIIYGLAYHKLAIAIFGFVLLIFVTPVIVGIKKFVGFTAQDIKLNIILFIILFLMLILPFKNWFYLAFNAVTGLFLLKQFILLIKNDSLGELDLNLITVFLWSNIFWSIYGFLFNVWPLKIICPINGSFTLLILIKGLIIKYVSNKKITA
jgi:hypothetical protein